MKQNTHSSLIKNIFSISKSLFLHGFFTLLPLAITFGIIRFAFRLIKSTLHPIYQLEPTILKQIPHSEIIITIIVIFILGMFCDVFLLKILHRIEHSILTKIPLLRQIYFGTKQLVDALNPRNKITLNKVILIQYPRPGIYSVGFVTNEIAPSRFPQLQGKYFSVFMPSVPNPTTGHYLIASEADCIFLDLSRQEALTLIISGGIIEPEKRP